MRLQLVSAPAASWKVFISLLLHGSSSPLCDIGCIASAHGTGEYVSSRCKTAVTVAATLCATELLDDDDKTLTTARRAVAATAS